MECEREKLYTKSKSFHTTKKERSSRKIVREYLPGKTPPRPATHFLFYFTFFYDERVSEFSDSDSYCLILLKRQISHVHIWEKFDVKWEEGWGWRWIWVWDPFVWKKLRPLMTMWMEIHHYDNLFFVYTLPLLSSIS